MTKQFRAGLPGLAVVLAAGCAAVQTPPVGNPMGNLEVVHVAPPTGERDTDRGSILAALEQVRPGGTIQFAPGTYHVGQVVRTEIPRLTLLGHPEGTVLRGCDLAVLEDLVAQLTEAIALRERGGRAEPPDFDICGILHLLEPGLMPVIEDNVIEGNEIIGGYGLGIEVVHASRNRIVDNAIGGIRARDPFPGNVLQDEYVGWREANGSGIWVSPGSDGNEIARNTFEDSAPAAIVVEGDRNRIETRSASDAVRDLGSGNLVSRADSVQTRIIDVDGHAVHVFTAGWEHLERGQPVVVFEGGGFSTLDAWGNLPARLAQETAVVAYDRAGSGRSEWDGQRPTLDHVTSRLRRILEVLGAPPPYIHVGHSFGGPLGFAFARQYPDELAGLVLVDPTPPAADWLGAFDDIGVGRAGYDEFDELFSRAFEGAPESLLIELDVLSGYLSDPDASPWSPPDLSVPVAVLLAGAGYEVPPDLPSTFDLDQQHQALLLRQVAN